METVNELIVKLVTASNDVETLEHQDVTRLIDIALGEIRNLCAQEQMADSAAVTSLEQASSTASTSTPEDWQRALRHAADMLRDLQPTVDPEPALPAHQPDGGDGGNY